MTSDARPEVSQRVAGLGTSRHRRDVLPSAMLDLQIF
eukprot:CAMPEP_0117467174 /NCGR_PEP_ID=MMETSP0784-20121206/5518_1 /TAXON_ID=39447 /ORGANISM="" /LENGTH=36 /DNA_ID= /DNA_START= /DNA_END= /DNA_ORIENTATION=